MKRDRHLRLGAVLAALLSGCVPLSVHAQYVPPWLVAAVLSPLLVLALCGLLGILQLSVRTAAMHAAGVVLWIVLFALASYFVENDYVIWTPLALYALHAVLLLALIAYEIVRRARRG